MMNEVNTMTDVNSPVATDATQVKPEVDTEEEKLKREMEVGEHDIVIEEDFVINLDVAAVSDDSALFAEPAAEVDNTPQVELGTEQSGNITF